MTLFLCFLSFRASIYHLSREQHVANSDKELRKKIVEVVLDSMSNLKNVLQLQKNCCLTLCNFKIPIELVGSFDCLLENSKFCEHSKLFQYDMPFIFDYL